MKMPDLEIMIFNQKLKLSYQDNEKHRLIKAVELLNKRWDKLSNLHGRVSDLKIVTLISLELQDLIENFETLKLKNKYFDDNIQILKKEIEIKNKELEKNIETKKKFEKEIKQKNNEISKIEVTLDDINDELLKIKNNLLKSNE